MVFWGLDGQPARVEASNVVLLSLQVEVCYRMLRANLSKYLTFFSAAGWLLAGIYYLHTGGTGVIELIHRNGFPLTRNSYTDLGILMVLASGLNLYRGFRKSIIAVVLCSLTAIAWGGFALATLKYMDNLHTFPLVLLAQAIFGMTTISSIVLDKQVRKEWSLL